MAFKPSKRRKAQEEMGELDLTPYMNFVMILIPVIMQASEYIKLAMLKIDLPPSAPSSSAGGVVEEAPQQTLDLAVSITSGGFTITSSKARLPIIPLKGNEYDYDELHKKLWEIKQQVQGQYPDEENIIIAAAQDIRYEVIVKTMDASRSHREGLRTYLMFPSVALSPGIT
jgi:biopolymer transport protein ExbD